MDEEERLRRREVIRAARALADGPPQAVDESARLETRQRERIDRRDDASTESEREIAAECRRAFDSWTASAADDPTESAEENAWDAWLTRRLEAERELIWSAVATAMVEMLDTERESIRGEIEARVGRLHLENARERSEDIKQQTSLVENVKEILTKLQRREFPSEELPSSRMN
jgi:hypothetical protein